MSVHFVRFYSGFDSEMPLFESFSEVSLEISKVYSKKIARFSVDFMLILHTAISYLLLWNICCLEIFFSILLNLLLAKFLLLFLFAAWSTICKRRTTKPHHWFQIAARQLLFLLGKQQKFQFWLTSMAKIWSVYLPIAYHVHF